MSSRSSSAPRGLPAGRRPAGHVTLGPDHTLRQAARRRATRCERPARDAPRGRRAGRDLVVVEGRRADHGARGRNTARTDRGSRLRRGPRCLASPIRCSTRRQPSPTSSSLATETNPRAWSCVSGLPPKKCSEPPRSCTPTSSRSHGHSISRPGRARVVRYLLEHSHIPLLLLPAES